MTGLIGRLRADLSLNTAQFRQGLAESRREAQGFSRSVSSGLAGLRTAALGVGAVSAVAVTAGTQIRRVMSEVARIGDSARLAGLSTDAFQELGYAAEQNRIPIDLMADGIKEMQLRIDEFIATGGGAAAESLRRMGFDATDLARRLERPEELFGEILERMRGLNTAGRIRVSDEIFGGSAGERFVQLVDQGARGLQRWREEAHQVGRVLDESVIERADEIERRFGEIVTSVNTLGQWLAVNIADRVVAEIDALEADMEDAARTAGRVMTAFSDDGAAARSMQAISFQLREMVEDAALMADLAERGGNQSLAAVFLGIAESSDTLNRSIAAGEIQADDFGQELTRLLDAAETALGAVDSIDDVTLTNAQRVIAALRGQLQQLGDTAAAAASDVAAATLGNNTGTPLFQQDVPLLPGDYGSGGMTTSPRPRRAPPMLGEPPATGSASGGGGSRAGFAQSVADIRARTQALEMEAASLAMVAVAGRQYGDAVEYARVRAQLMNDALQDGQTLTPELQAEIDALAQSFANAGDRASAAAEQIAEIERNTENGITTMTDLFFAMAQGGDQARQAVARLTMEIARAQITDFLRGSSGGGFGGFLSFLGGLTGKRAMGGPVEGGSAYLVNEHTPNSEIFVPSRSGAVLNVAQAQSALRDQAVGAQAVSAHITVGVDPDTGNITAVVDNQLRRARPSIIGDAVAATRESAQIMRIP